MNKLLDFFWLIVRLAGFWLAVYGYGRFLQTLLKSGKYRLPVHFAGIVFFIFLSLPLSLAGLFLRPVLTWILVAGMILGAYSLIRSFSLRSDTRKIDIYGIILSVLAVFILCSNTLRASVPHSNPDALVTYAVQPDRWLSSGSIYYMKEVMFSGYPLSGEILAAWPASLAANRTDQLSILQIFQMSLLLLACITAWKTFGKGMIKAGIVVLACMATSMLAGWASLPKVEMTALYFTTLAFCSCYRQYCSSERVFSPVPFIAMGLALSSKLTVYVALPSFLLLMLSSPFYRKMKNAITAVLLISIIPIVFSVRSTIVTGTPFYPWSDSIIQASAEYTLEEIPGREELERQNVAPNDLLGNKEPEPFFVNVSELVSSWGLPAVVFVLGIAALTLKKKLEKALIPVGVIVLYIILASIVFNPLRWGAKYAFLLSPFMAALGTKWTEGLKVPRISFYGFMAVFLVTSSVTGRFNYVINYPGDEPLDFRPPDTVPVKPLHEWCNENLPSDSVLLSMWKRERYFYDGTVIVIENHPLGRRLFLTEYIEEEMEILESMDVDYVYFQSSDPMPGDLEDLIVFLDSDRLEYVNEVSGFTLCRVLY
ncbi:MAG: hypothetical protein GF388_00985 [Candidatus Aegiribacteria sp.]|nr:hypothetical protein [Candidatus Aegiribacteria sp.]MBD3293980.1 hypothetical protein [Candidatus Fermentibacteria bacterium]